MTNKKIITVLAISLVFIFSAVAFADRNNRYSISLFNSAGGWGYDISFKNKLIIHQPYMPALGGQTPFEDKYKARKAGRLVIKKLRIHKSPCITRDEINSIIGFTTEGRD